MTAAEAAQMPDTEAVDLNRPSSSIGLETDTDQDREGNICDGRIWAAPLCRSRT